MIRPRRWPIRPRPPENWKPPRRLRSLATEISGPQRLTLLLRIAGGFLGAGEAEEAVPLLNSALSVAVLDPTNGGFERSRSLIQIAEGLFTAGEEEAAKDAALQAMRIAEQTPQLLPAHRSELYEDLRPLANKLGDADFSQELGELARDPYYEAPATMLASKLPLLGTGVALEPSIEAAIASREQAARVLADRIVLTEGADIGPETQALGVALIGEDQVRQDFYRRALNEGLSLEDQYALLVDQRNWTAVKLRIALQGFGLSLVPEWERDPVPLRQELGAATANLGLVADALANALPDPSEQAALRLESLLWLAQQAEIELFPGASLEDLNSRLQAAQADVIRLGAAPALPVSLEPSASPPGFRIQSIR